jgi:hypothetical protein
LIVAICASARSLPTTGCSTYWLLKAWLRLLLILVSNQFFWVFNSVRAWRRLLCRCVLLEVYLRVIDSLRIHRTSSRYARTWRSFVSWCASRSRNSIWLGLILGWWICLWTCNLRGLSLLPVVLVVPVVEVVEDTEPVERAGALHLLHVVGLELRALCSTWWGCSRLPSSVSIWYLDWSVSERTQDRFWVLLPVRWLALGWRSTSVVVIWRSATALDRRQRVTVSYHHAVIVWQHLLVSHTCVPLFLRSHLRGGLRLRDPTSCCLGAVHLWWVLSVLCIAARTKGLLPVVVPGGWDANVGVSRLVLVIDSTATSCYRRIYSVSGAWLVVRRHLLWSWAWSRRGWDRVQISRGCWLFLLATILVMAWCVWTLVWSSN